MLSSRNFLMLAGLGALLATLVLVAGVVTRPGGAGTLPAADAAPTSTTTSTTSTTRSDPYAADTRGFVDSKARCDDGQTAVALGRTQRSLVVICSTSTGGYEYRAVRVSDDADLQTPATATSDGFEADTDGAVYSVSPTELVVTSNDKVIYRDTWIEYRQQPTFTTATTATTTTAKPTG